MHTGWPVGGGGVSTGGAVGGAGGIVQPLSAANRAKACARVSPGWLATHTGPQLGGALGPHRLPKVQEPPPGIGGDRPLQGGLLPQIGGRFAAFRAGVDPYGGNEAAVATCAPSAVPTSATASIGISRCE